VQTEILEYFSKLTKAEIGQLPENGGFVLQMAPSSSGTAYLDGSSDDNMSLLFLCKNKSQKEAITTLENVCNILTRNKRHSFGIYNIYVATQPNYVEKAGEFWIYSCIINFKYHNKEVL